MLFIIIIVIIIIVAAKPNKKQSGGQDMGNAAMQNTSSNEVSYSQRINLYQNAIEQNRYHSISKLARDYHLPVHLVIQDIKQLQGDGFLMDIKVEHNHDEIVYLDEESRKMRNRKTEQAASSVKDIQAEQSAYSGQSVAYTKTRTKVQKHAGTSNSQKSQQDSQETKAQQVKNRTVEADKKTKSGNQKFEVNISDGISVGGAQEEYQADYSMTEAMYNYIAEYPDTSHIWDELNLNLFPKDTDMLMCQKCGTENIIVRNTQGICNCYYCQEELI